MRITKSKITAVFLTLALAMSIAGAQPNSVQSHALAQSVEAKTIGRGCAAIWGFGIALGVASLSGCSIICGTAAWYTLLLLKDC